MMSTFRTVSGRFRRRLFPSFPATRYICWSPHPAGSRSVVPVSAPTIAIRFFRTKSRPQLPKSRWFEGRQRLGFEGLFQLARQPLPINHIDNERANNCIENLQPMHSKDHQRMTIQQEGRRCKGPAQSKPLLGRVVGSGHEWTGPSSRARMMLEGKRDVCRPVCLVSQTVIGRKPRAKQLTWYGSSSSTWSMTA